MAEHPQAERARSGYQAFAAQDMQALDQLLTDDLVWHVPGSSPLAGDYKGKQDVFGFFTRIMQETEGTFRIEVHDIVANDEHVVALVRLTADRRGRHYEQNGVHVYHPDAEGRIKEFWNFTEDSAVADEFWS